MELNFSIRRKTTTSSSNFNLYLFINLIIPAHDRTIHFFAHDVMTDEQNAIIKDTPQCSIPPAFTSAFDAAEELNENHY